MTNESMEFAIREKDMEGNVYRIRNAPFRVNKYATGIIIDVAKTTEHIVKVKLENGDVLEFPGSDKEQYSCGDTVKVRNVIRLRNDRGFEGDHVLGRWRMEGYLEITLEDIE